jgi:hypothetical protein
MMLPVLENRFRIRHTLAKGMTKHDWANLWTKWHRGYC